MSKFQTTRRLRIESAHGAPAPSMLQRNSAMNGEVQGGLSNEPDPDMWIRRPVSRASSAKECRFMVPTPAPAAIILFLLAPQQAPRVFFLTLLSFTVARSRRAL